MIDVSFYNYLTLLTALPVQQDVISEDKANARVWFRRSRQDTELLASGLPSYTETTFDVEVATLNIDQAQTEANNIRTALNGFRGLMYMDTVLGSFVEDASDDYVPRNLSADEGFHVAAFEVRIIS